MAVATESPIGPDTWTGSKSPKSFGEVEVAVLQAMETKIPSHDVWSSMAEAYMEIPAVDKGETGTPTTSVDSLPVVEDRGIDALPRHIDLLQLNELNWNQLAGHQEWRTTLHLRNLTWKLCDEGTLQTFLERSGLMESIEKIRVKPGIGQRSGSATLRVKTVEEVGKVAKFFHGRQFPGARSPVAVSFAHSHCRAPDPFKVPQPSFGDPYRVECEHLSDEPLTLPPGL